MLKTAEAFIRECRDRDYAESSIETHTESLETFSEWAEEQELQATDCSAADIEAFVQWVKREKPIPYPAIRSELFWSLQKYFEFLVDEEEIPQNPCSEVDIVDAIILDEGSRYLGRVRGTKAEGTIKNRELGLIQFTEWLEEEEQLDFEECTPLLLEDYAIYLKQQGYSDTTVKDKFSAVTMLYKFRHEKEQKIDENPAESVNLGESDADIIDYENPTRKSDELADDIVYVTRGQKEKLKEHCPGPKIRNELLIELMWQTGLRREEVANITIEEDLDREKREIKIIGKNDKGRTVFYQPTLDTLLSLWLDDVYRDSFNHSESSEYLFLTLRSEQIHPHQINEIVVEAAKNAGIQSTMYTDGNDQTRHKITAHSLRHGFAVKSLKNGMDIKTLADIMGHDSLDTTKDYLELITEDLRNRYRKYGPEGTAE